MKALKGIIPGSGFLLYLIYLVNNQALALNRISFHLAVMFAVSAILFGFNQKLLFARLSILITIMLLLTSSLLFLMLKWQIAISASIFLVFLLMIQLLHKYNGRIKNSNLAK